MFQTSNCTTLSMFADDTAILAVVANTQFEANYILQDALDKIKLNLSK